MCPPAPSAQNRTAVWLFTMNAPADGAAVDIPTTSGSEIRIPRRAAGGFFCPAGGLFSPLGRGGNVCAPHFFFSRERKRNVPRPVQRKRALGAAFVAKAAPFSFVLYVLVAGVLVLCGLVSPFAPLPLTGAGGLAFMLKNLAFHWKTAASYGDRDTVWQG